MNIKTVRAYSESLLLTKPYTIARETIATAEIIFFEIELSNGISGKGAANTDVDVVGETPTQTLQNLQSDLVQQLVGKDIRQFLSLINHYRTTFPKFPGTMAAIDIALHDAFGKWIGLPVVDFYGRHHSKMLTSVTIGIKNVEETIKEALEYKQQGFKVLKVKTGLDASEDAERVIKLFERFGNHFTVRVDANEGYKPQDLYYFLSQTEETNLELIEQPFQPELDSALLGFPEQTRMALAADESLKDAKSAMTIAQQKTFGIFNIKLMKCGGITAAFEIANIARQAGIELFWGCNDESSLSITAALHAAFACPHTKYLDLDGSLDLIENISESGFVLEDGFLSINAQPGF
ncbi:dipeptide epimerase [Dyadobacter sp. 32]|uniref:mandelate racemase/muconate lactonizing enzyme family protein n=1 Tax=Dyadobacter sp. 32 TaxID=538966 RepID=UPI0011F08647